MSESQKEMLLGVILIALVIYWISKMNYFAAPAKVPGVISQSPSSFSINDCGRLGAASVSYYATMGRYYKSVTANIGILGGQMPTITEIAKGDYDAAYAQSLVACPSMMAI